MRNESFGHWCYVHATRSGDNVLSCCSQRTNSGRPGGISPASIGYFTINPCDWFRDHPVLDRRGWYGPRLWPYSNSSMYFEVSFYPPVSRLSIDHLRHLLPAQTHFACSSLAQRNYRFHDSGVHCDTETERKFNNENNRGDHSREP